MGLLILVLCDCNWLKLSVTWSNLYCVKFKVFILTVWDNGYENTWKILKYLSNININQILYQS